jgi:hypothetical protein
MQEDAVGEGGPWSSMSAAPAFLAMPKGARSFSRESLPSLTVTNGACGRPSNGASAGHTRLPDFPVRRRVLRDSVTPDRLPEGEVLYCPSRYEIACMQAQMAKLHAQRLDYLAKRRQVQLFNISEVLSSTLEE